MDRHLDQLDEQCTIEISDEELSQQMKNFELI
jgi:hypothetical protein